jgi:nitrogen regulatory protein P-II 1
MEATDEDHLCDHPPRKTPRRARALFKADVRGLSISRAQGHGGEVVQVTNYRGTTAKMELHEKVRLDIGVSDPFVDLTVETVMKAARTGEVGDGKIFVIPVEKVYRIRTGEEDVDAKHRR